MAAALALGALPSLAAGKKPKCFPRKGHCVVAVVNRQGTLALDKATKKLLEQLELEPPVSYYVGETEYRVPQPIEGELVVEATAAEGAEGWLGGGRAAEIQVIPLDPVEIDTEQQVVASPSVRIEGKAALSVANVMRDNILPPGRYLLRITLRGASNWDRQLAYLVVRE